jgi:hypothetical protein
MRWNIFKNVEVAGNIPLNVEVLPKPTFVNSKVFTNAHTFCGKLEQKGFKKLGSGAYSTVYSKAGSDRVIKVGRQPDDGWIDYCKWAAENGFAGNLAPKVYSYKRIKGKEREFSVAVMERMDKTGYNITGNMDAAPIRYLIQMDLRHDNDMVKLLLDTISPKFREFGGKMRERFGGCFDLHDGNIMARKDGSVCFTDPLASDRHAKIRRRLKEKDFSLQLAA